MCAWFMCDKMFTLSSLAVCNLPLETCHFTRFGTVFPMLKLAHHTTSALHWIVSHWGILMVVCVWGHSLCFQPLFSAKLAGCSIYIFLRRDKNSVNISPRSSCSALGSPAFPWLCGGWCALIVTTVACNSSKQYLNCHQIEIWMFFNWE